MNKRGDAMPLGRRFQKGQSGNPGGRPKTAILSNAYRELLEVSPGDDGKTYAEIIAKRVVESAVKGNLRAAQELADRTEGRSQQVIGVQILRYLSQMSSGQLEDLVFRIQGLRTQVQAGSATDLLAPDSEGPSLDDDDLDGSL